MYVFTYVRRCVLDRVCEKQVFHCLLRLLACDSWVVLVWGRLVCVPVCASACLCVVCKIWAKMCVLLYLYNSIRTYVYKCVYVHMYVCTYEYKVFFLKYFLVSRSVRMLFWLQLVK
jgi:hypothetical protein